MTRALLAVAVIGVAALWLYGLRDLDPRLSATPYVELELPPADADAPAPERASGSSGTAGATVVPTSAGEVAADAGPMAASADAANGDQPIVAEDGPDTPEEDRASENRTSRALPAEAQVEAAAEPGEKAQWAAVAEPAEPDRIAVEPPPAPVPPDPKESSSGTPATEPETKTSMTDPAAAEEAPPSPEAVPQVAAAGLPGAASMPAWRRFARPFPADDPRPRIAVIVAELGLRETSTRAAIDRLPASVTLSFSPYGRKLQGWIDAARAAGHEVMLDLPMEPVSYPHDDPGPKALFTALPEVENRIRLEWVLSRADGYVGVVPWMGSRFTTSAEDLRPVLARVRDRGLMFVDARPSPDSVAAALAQEMGVPRAVNTRFLDHVPSREAIEARLRQIEREARATGFAVGLASPYPITIETLDRWIRTLDEKGVVLAPISAVANRQGAARREAVR